MEIKQYYLNVTVMLLFKKYTIKNITITVWLFVSPLNSRWDSKPQCGDLEGGVWEKWFDCEDGDFLKRITSLKKRSLGIPWWLSC